MIPLTIIEFDLIAGDLLLPVAFVGDSILYSKYTPQALAHEIHVLLLVLLY